MITMFDAVTVSNIPKNAKYVAGYVGGLFTTFPVLQKQFPDATLLSIAINASENAQCLDVETGDASVFEVAGWVKRQLANKVSRPVIYASVGNMNSILSTLAANGISRQNVRLWAAHYAQGEHICGPSSCGQISVDMDGTQWTDNANGISLDQSALTDHFFSATTTPVETMNVPATIQNGAKGDYVVRAQAILNHLFDIKLTVDGNFGPATTAAVKQAQKSKGLSQDGVIGPNTWRMIYGG